ncbi:hypothetical protein IJJ02_01605 [Candidatus Saccharibacteria bacterium]|nr:hypothetical protein [Candidatus Saccharibacteria bacterium]
MDQNKKVSSELAGGPAAQKKWLRKEAMKTFTADELARMAKQKQKKTTKKVNTCYGLSFGLPKGYDEIN